jgi:hypothetical protein
VKLDWDLLRDILETAENCKGSHPLVCSVGIYGSPHYKLNIADLNHSYHDVCEHFLLLHDASLAIVRNLGTSSDGPVGVVLDRLTMQGHEFLAAARNETGWGKAKEVAKQVGGFTVQQLFNFLMAYVKAEVKERTGIEV